MSVRADWPRGQEHSAAEVWGRVITLLARTLFIDGPGRRERRVLDDAGAFAAALSDHFGIDPGALSPRRLGRLWAKGKRSTRSTPEERRAHLGTA